MKKNLFLIAGFIVAVTSYSQTPDSSKIDKEYEFEITENGADEVEIVSEEVVIEPEPDTTEIEIGDLEIKIVDNDDETAVFFKENEDSDTTKDEKYKWELTENKKKKFKGHWAGFEVGLNNYVDKDFSISRTPENSFMDLNTAKSWNFNLNFTQYSLPLIGTRFGMVTGMGVEWNNYHFAKNSTIQKNVNTETVEELPLQGSLKKNRLQTTYLTVPLLMELQLFKGKRSKRLYVATGVIGGLKVFSNTKYKATVDGVKKSDKQRSDFYLSPFRYGVTGRIGYKSINLYMNYYPTPLFVEGRGPELYPFALGLAAAF